MSPSRASFKSPNTLAACHAESVASLPCHCALVGTRVIVHPHP